MYVCIYTGISKLNSNPLETNSRAKKIKKGSNKHESENHSLISSNICSSWWPLELGGLSGHHSAEFSICTIAILHYYTIIITIYKTKIINYFTKNILKIM